MKTTLYKKDNRGKLRMWSIDHDYDTLIIEHGLVTGLKQYKTEVIPRGLQGRTIEQQTASRVQSRINLQLDKGYCHTVDEANVRVATNTLGLPLPMLAQRYDKVRTPMAYYVQRKYDGNRCLITNEEGEIKAYSRQGKNIPSIPHILDAARHIPEGMVLDGELYHHGTPLQTIRSWVARSQADSEKLNYICYDHVGSGGYAKRHEELVSLGLDLPIALAPTDLLAGSEASTTALSVRMREALEGGYEGLIIRHPDGKYEPGKRSKNLIKLKTGMLDGVPIEEEEFLVMDIIPSKDGWGILVCGCPHGTFKVTAPGTMENKYEVYKDRMKYLGSNITVQFANYTPDGIPFHPVAISFRAGHE